MKGNACSVSYVSQPQLCVAGKGFTAYCQTSSATAAAPCHPSHLARATRPSSFEASQCLDFSFSSEAQPHHIFIRHQVQPGFLLSLVRPKSHFFVSILIYSWLTYFSRPIMCVSEFETDFILSLIEPLFSPFSSLLSCPRACWCEFRVRVEEIVSTWIPREIPD